MGSFAEIVTLFAWVLGLGGLVYAKSVYNKIVAVNVDNEKMRNLEGLIHNGAMSFLKREYSILVVFVVVVALLLAWKISIFTALAFLFGATCSAVAGWFGMFAATKANVRTTQAAQNEGPAAALAMAFAGGNVMGVLVASLGLLGLGIVFL